MKLLIAPLAVLALSGAAAADTWKCGLDLAQKMGVTDGEWSVNAEAEPLEFTLSASQACAATQAKGCEGSLVPDFAPDMVVPCTASGPAGGLICPIEWVATIFVHPGSGYFTVLEVEHLLEGRTSPDVMLAVGRCAPV